MAIFPVSDDNSDRRIFPFVSIALIAMNILVYAGLQQFGANDRFTYAFAAVPAEITTGQDLATDDIVLRDLQGRVVVDPATGQAAVRPGLQKLPLPLTVYFTLLSSIFMHGSLMHIFGNMWFLWIFGDNIEDDFGHGMYLVFYLLCGFLASAAHVMMNVNSLVPSLGASGAISGVMGAYMVLHSRRKVNVLFMRQFIVLPGIAAVGIWIALQLFMGLSSFSGQGDGVAYAAHIGGFGAGAILCNFFKLFGGRRVPGDGGSSSGAQETNRWGSQRRRPSMDDLFNP